MRITLAALVAVLLSAAPAAAQTGGNGYSQPHESHAYAGWRHPHQRRTNGRNDCPNMDCRGINSPGNMGGAPGDF